MTAPNHHYLQATIKVFLIYTVIHFETSWLIFEYSSTGDNIVCFLNYFVGHRCSVKGCGNVIVLDENVKNARTVCSCNSVGEIVFEGIGNVVIGT